MNVLAAMPFFVEMNINVDPCDIPITTAYFVDIEMSALNSLRPSDAYMRQ